MDVDAWVEACVETVKSWQVPMTRKFGHYEVQADHPLVSVLRSKLKMVPSENLSDYDVTAPDRPITLSCYVYDTTAAIEFAERLARGKWQEVEFTLDVALACGFDVDDAHWTGHLPSSGEVQRRCVANFDLELSLPKLRITKVQRSLFQSLVHEGTAIDGIDLLRAVAALAE